MCVCVHMDKNAWVGRYHVKLSPLHHACDFAYQALPLFLRAILKRWEWPGDEATLEIEHDKICPNRAVVDLMAQSFATRWNDLHNIRCGLDTV